MTDRTWLDARGRGAAAALLAAVAVVGSLLLGPAGARAAAPAGATAGSPAARGTTPSGVVARDRGDAVRPGPRRGARDRTALDASSWIGRAQGHGPAPAAVVLLATLVLPALVAVGARRPADATPAALGAGPSWRGRAPPAYAAA